MPSVNFFPPHIIRCWDNKNVWLLSVLFKFNYRIIYFFYTSYRVVFRSGEGVTSAASTSQVPTSHLPVQASQKSLSFYSLMLVSARKIDAPKGGRCCRYSGCCGTCMPYRGGASLENLSALLGSLLEINCADEYKMFDEFYLMIFSFSFTTHAHRHALFTQSTLCHICCFVSSATVCGYSIKRFWKVLPPHVFFVSSCYRLGRCFYSTLEIHLRKIVRTKCFK